MREILKKTILFSYNSCFIVLWLSSLRETGLERATSMAILYILLAGIAINILFMLVDLVVFVKEIIESCCKKKNKI